MVTNGRQMDLLLSILMERHMENFTSSSLKASHRDPGNRHSSKV